MKRDALPALTREDLKVGQVYEAKKPRRVGMYVNDRQIIWIGMFEVQYDGPAVANGRHYPRITIEVFIAWAARNVTSEMPADLSWRA